MNREKIMTPYSGSLRGIALSDGKGEGRIWHANGSIPKRYSRRRKISDALVTGEISRVRHAIQLFSLVLENSILQVTQRLGESYAAIFIALREMLHDPLLLKSILEHIETGHLDAGSAMTAALDMFQKRFSDMSNPLMKERANDLLELQGSLLDALSSPDRLYNSSKPDPHAKGKPADAIAVVETLTPRLVLDLKNTNVSGIVCERAGPTSHAAILCRAFGIPAVEGIHDIFGQLPQGAYAIIDGTNGTVGTAVRRSVIKPMEHNDDNPGSPAEKDADISKISLMANLSLAKNAIAALSAGAEGIGLYRTEFEFMAANRLLTKQEQFKLYRSVVMAMMGLPVTIRLIDVAQDKPVEVLNATGTDAQRSYGGAQFLLSRPDLLEAQARAIAEASAFGPIRVLYPMVADARQFIALKTMFCAAVAKDSATHLLHGAMIEHPSAVNDARGILETADFVCLGTNDLTKHLLNVDRDTAVAHGSEIVNSPILWTAIADVASMASAVDKELTVCGEMASDLRLLTRFTDLGITKFSMGTCKIRRLRKYAAGLAANRPASE